MNTRGFDAQRLDALRQNFDAEFAQMLSGAQLTCLPSWFERGPSSDPFETTIQRWMTSDGTRTMVVEETEATDTLSFRWFTERTGMAYEIEMLHMNIRNTDHHVPFVVECYRRWLLDREDETSVNAFIEEYVAAAA